MSTAPARSRSLRKPAAEGSRRYDKPAADVPAETETGTETETPRERERSNVSPSRLPKPPSSTMPSASLSRSTTISRPVTAAVANGSSVRPSTQRTGVSRPPLTSDNKSLSLRSGARARTPTEGNSSLQRAPSTRHSRNSSTSALPSRPSSSSGSNNTITTTTARTQLFPPSASTLIRPPSSTSISTSSSHPLDASRIAAAHRPAFSTLQQHFSPARSLAPKPPTHTFLAPPSPSKLPAALAITAETARLQAELLQLHLLHRSAAPTYANFRASARSKLRARFQDVRAAHDQLVALEALETESRNVRALKAWAEDDGGGSGGAGHGWAGLEAKIQVLEQVLSAVWKLSEPGGGRYARVVKRFERWLHGAAEILQARKEQARPNPEESMFVEELDADWRDEVQNLARKVAQWTQQLDSLGDLPSHVQGSGLALVVRGVRDLVLGMGDEVRAMERVERGVVAAEEAWVREAIEEGDDNEGDMGAVVVWRTG